MAGPARGPRVRLERAAPPLPGRITVNESEKTEVMEPLRAAERFWQDKVEPAGPRSECRRPMSEADLRYWLENMVRYHRLSPAEVSAAAGLTLDELRDALARFELIDPLGPCARFTVAAWRNQE